MSTTYIEDFLEQTNNLPREIIRNLKQIREVDEKYIKNIERYNKLKTLLSQGIKSKSKDSIKNSETTDLVKNIQAEFDNLTHLSDYKLEATNECIYLVEYHLRKLNEIIDSFENNIRHQQVVQNELNKNGKIPADKNADGYIANGKSKQRIEEPEKEEKFLNRKKLHFANKKKKSAEATTQLQHNLSTSNFNDNLTNDIGQDKEAADVQSEPVYCKCRGISYGNMVCCDNNSCTFQWFHFDCVGLNSMPKGKWFCSNECRANYKKKGK